jgi:hypothetical protein
MALAPDIGLLLTCEIDKYIDLVASERVHELDGVLHYRNPQSARAPGEVGLSSLPAPRSDTQTGPVGQGSSFAARFAPPSQLTARVTLRLSSRDGSEPTSLGTLARKVGPGAGGHPSSW